MPRSVAILLMAAAAAAQTGAPAPAFEVASVKRFVPQPPPGVRAVARSDPGRSDIQISGTRVSARGNLVRLVGASYGLETYQVMQNEEWADKWAGSEVYEISARAPGDAIPTAAQVRAMMQTLLAERFQLKISHRNQVMPVYNLVVAPGGPKIKPSTVTDPPLTRNDGSTGSQIRLRCVNLPMADLVELVRRQFDHPLIDKTGLTGGFDFTLEYNFSDVLPGATADGATEPGIPLVASLRQQLGLAVVRAREPVGILVIDHAERPAAN